MKIAGRDIDVKTLTVGQCREVLESLEDANMGRSGFVSLDAVRRSFAEVEGVSSVLESLESECIRRSRVHIVDMLMDDDIPASAAAAAAGISLEEMAGAVDPQELASLFKEVRAKNPFLLGMMERLIGAARAEAEKAEPSQQKN